MSLVSKETDQHRCSRLIVASTRATLILTMKALLVGLICAAAGVAAARVGR